MKRMIFPCIMTAILVGSAQAHHPDRANQPVRPRVDVIGPVGNRLPPSYRRVYNRPTNLGGKIAYWIAPTSQEAIAWHHAQHTGAYERGLPRQERYYFYPKPWEALQVGPRPAHNSPTTLLPMFEAEADSAAHRSVHDSIDRLGTSELDHAQDLPRESQSLGDPLMLDDDQ